MYLYLYVYICLYVYVYVYVYYMRMYMYVYDMGIQNRLGWLRTRVVQNRVWETSKHSV